MKESSGKVKLGCRSSRTRLFGHGQIPDTESSVLIMYIKTSVAQINIKHPPTTEGTRGGEIKNENKVQF